MKKVIVNRENYEEVMFNLIENEYPDDVRDNILEQINADTLLSFEWQQWQKSMYSESTEFYKDTEAEFIEGLTRTEHKKGGMVRFFMPMSVAASVALIFGLYLIFGYESQTEYKAVENSTLIQKQIETPVDSSSEIKLAERKENKENKQSDNGFVQNENPVSDIAITPEVIGVDSILKTNDENKNDEIKMASLIRDSVDMLIARAKKHESRYKITIVSESIEGGEQKAYRFNEKRYTMADVLKRKDGISLSKFLDNANSKVIRENNKVYIEYTAEDDSVLILYLSN